jgi:hypothetical protein
MQDFDVVTGPPPRALKPSPASATPGRSAPAAPPSPQGGRQEKPPRATMGANDKV